jgi:hypothetical protein
VNAFRIIDYLSIAPDTEVKQSPNGHAALNIGAPALTAANVMARRNARHHRGGSLAMSAIAAEGVPDRRCGRAIVRLVWRAHGV